jgi:thymidine kinase
MIRRHAFIQRKTLCVTSSIDTRYSKDVKIITHDKESYPAISTEKLMDLLLLHSFHVAECVIIEEAQFFDDLYTFVETLVDTYQKDVIVVGLDGDTERKPFGQIISLVPMCDKITKLKAFCKICANGNEALFTYCKKEKHEQICVGGEDIYMPLCRIHYLSKISNC